MKKVLIIMGQYFPKPSANGICVEQVAKELIEQGIEVSIIATKLKGMSSYEELDGVKIFRVRGRLFNRAMEWSSSIRNAKLERLCQKTILLFNKVKTILFLPVWPLLSPMYSYRLFRKSLELHKINNYEGVISVYNPIDALIAGSLLKKKDNNIKLILYFLDTLSGGIVPQYFSRAWLQEKGGRWEKKFFELADSISIMEPHRDNYFTENFKDFHKKINVLDIPLLRKIKYSRNTISSFEKKKTNLVYAGTLLKKLKNPSYMLETFNVIQKNSKLNFHVYGGGDCREILEKNNSLQQNNSVIIHGQVDVSTVHNALLEADILINIGSLVDAQIPGKIFEYMATGKPIISFYKYETEPSIPYLKKYPLSLLIKEDKELLEENVLKMNMFINNNKGKVLDEENIRNTFKNNTPDPMVDNVKKIINA